MGHKPLFYSNKQIQSRDSLLCGYFCVYMLACQLTKAYRKPLAVSLAATFRTICS